MDRQEGGELVIFALLHVGIERFDAPPSGAYLSSDAFGGTISHCKYES